MRILLAFLLSFFVTSVWAADDNSRYDAMLNKVVIQFNAEQWVISKTALVTVGVNATLNAGGLDKIQDEILKKLSDISSQGDWHIVSFDRSQDSSGLDKVVISAQARLPNGSLSALRDRAKSLTKPGETFTLDNITYTPSEEDLRQANTDLRATIYAQTKDEIERLDKMYSDQHYYVHDVDFVREVTPISPMPMAGNYMAMRAMPASSSSSNLAVGDKLTITATVVLAALPADHNLLKNIT
jgi:hypothetical protein